MIINSIIRKKGRWIAELEFRQPRRFKFLDLFRKPKETPITRDIYFSEFGVIWYRADGAKLGYKSAEALYNAIKASQNVPEIF